LQYYTLCIIQTNSWSLITLFKYLVIVYPGEPIALAGRLVMSIAYHTNN